jgi:DNA-binding transcriptional ArsR family regulator
MTFRSIVVERYHMSTNGGTEDPTTLSPDEAFGVLGNETRMAILRSLGRTDGSLSFSDLYDRIDYDTPSNFSYHLDQLEGHFVTKSDDGYELSPRGSQVYQAVLSGALTESPTVEPTELEENCYHCGTPIWTDYRNQRGFIYCPGCSGNHDISEDVLVDRLGSKERAAEFAVKSSHLFPPALVRGRSASEMRRAGAAWFNLDMFALGIDLCPRCSAPLDPSVAVCESHNDAEELCEACGNLQAVMLVTTCMNCNYSKDGLFSFRLFAHTAMLDFITDHGLNPIAPEFPEQFWGYFTPYDEEILSIDPFTAEFTFTIDNEALTLTVDDDLNVVETLRHTVSELD